MYNVYLCQSNIRASKQKLVKVDGGLRVQIILIHRWVQLACNRLSRCFSPPSLRGKAPHISIRVVISIFASDQQNQLHFSKYLESESDTANSKHIQRHWTQVSAATKGAINSKRIQRCTGVHAQLALLLTP